MREEEPTFSERLMAGILMVAILCFVGSMLYDLWIR